MSAINAPNFLCEAAIDQPKSPPNDEQRPGAFYRCIRAMHCGCSNAEGAEFAKSEFDLLHVAIAKAVGPIRARFGIAAMAAQVLSYMFSVSTGNSLE